MFHLFLFFFGFCPWLAVAHYVYFCLGPARASERKIDAIFRFNRSGLGVATCRARFRKARRSPSATFLLDYFLSPAIAYVYLGRYGLALLSFVTFGGLGVWWLVSLFTLPYAALRQNEAWAETIAEGGTPESLLEHVERRFHEYVSPEAA